MFSDQFIESKLHSLLNKVKNYLTTKDIDFIAEEIDCREWGLAFEVLCEQLSENNASISSEVYNEFCEIGELMHIEKKYLSYVQKLTQNESIDKSN